MNARISSWWPFHARRSSHSQEAGAGLFQGLRIRLTLWYCVVLAAALVLFGMLLYFSTQYSLLNPIENNAAFHAQEHESQWLTGSPFRACPSLNLQGQFGPPDQGQGYFNPEVVVCFDQNGSLLPGQSNAGLPSGLLPNDLAKRALQTNQPVGDIVDGGDTNGPIYRYALVVPNPSGNGDLGVVVVGESVKAQEAALSVLLTLLLSIGGVALLGAGVGGLFLSNRALEPARLAWTNQQRFIADASHELRTPLTLLRADAEVLLRGRSHMAEEDSALLEDIVAEANHMATLANNMLTLARLDAGAVHREHDVVNLVELAQQGVRRVQAFANQRNITVQVEHSDNPYVIGDPMLLDQAVMALLDNAVKYNRQDGSVMVRIAAHNTQAVLEVQDTGIGIATEHLPHLGKRFYRVDKARSREAGGTGLGLSIARNIALTHGGQLTLSSIPDQGTTVTLTLPLAQGMSPDTSDDDVRVYPLP